MTDGLQIAVTRVAVTTVTETVDVPPTDQQVDDPALDKGTTVVAVAGTPGKQQVVTQVTTVNGAETARQEVSRTTVTEADPEPGARRLQVHPGRPGQPGLLPRHRVRRQLGRAGLLRVDQQPARGEQPGRLTCPPTGSSSSTCRPGPSVGGSGNPGDASPEEQLMRAKLLYQSRGLEPWLCGYAASGPPAG